MIRNYSVAASSSALFLHQWHGGLVYSVSILPRTQWVRISENLACLCEIIFFSSTTLETKIRHLEFSISQKDHWPKSSVLLDVQQNFYQTSNTIEVKLACFGSIFHETKNLAISHDSIDQFFGRFQMVLQLSIATTSFQMLLQFQIATTSS